MKKKVTQPVIKPIMTMVYFENDICKILGGLSPMYNFVSAGNATLEYFHDGRGNRTSVKDAINKIEKYLKDNNIVSKDLKLSSSMNATHMWGSENDEGNCPSVYGIRMSIRSF